MSWTKRQIVDQAFAAVGLGAYAFDLTADERESALRALDAMMATWATKGLRIGYNTSTSPGSTDIGDDSGLPDYAIEAAYLNLALRLADAYGKQVSPGTAANAKQAYSALLAWVSKPIEMRLDAVPAGAGLKPYRGGYTTFIRPGAQPIAAGPDSEMEFGE